MLISHESCEHGLNHECRWTLQPMLRILTEVSPQWLATDQNCCQKNFVLPESICTSNLRRWHSNLCRRLSQTINLLRLSYIGCATSSVQNMMWICSFCSAIHSS